MARKFGGLNLGSLLNGLVLASPLDDLTGLTGDVSGNRFEGTVNGAVRGEPGDPGNSFEFDGIGDNVLYTQAALAAKFASKSAFAVEIWFKLVAFGVDQCAFSIADNAGDDVFAIYPGYNPGGMDPVDSVYIWFNGSFIMTPASSHATGTFLNLIYNQTSDTSRELFISGSSIGTDTSSNSLVAGIDAVTYGGYGNPVIEEFPGNLAYVRAWERGITAEEIARLQIIKS